jgi:glycine/D-amino acid oxidase-like deaminating enzyme/nitrite reductase/ring-hydroxylating ferredoxin subunit
VEQQSVWLATAELPRFETASGEIAADLAVVGGGLVGLTTALLAARDGADVVVLEADRLGSGTSGNTTGKVTSQHGMIYDELISRHGEDQARQYAEANHAAIERVAGLVDELGIDCELERTTSYLYTNDEGQESALRSEAAAASGLGLPARLGEADELGLPARTVMCFDDQVQLHPVRYLAGLAGELTRAGVRLYEGSRVTDVDEKDDAVVLATAAGATVRARQVVMATLLPIGTIGGYFARTRPSRSYGIAVRLNSPAPHGMAISIDTPSRSTRPWPGGGPNGLIVVGGGHETGETEETRPNYQGLVDWVRATWDVGLDAFEYRWSAQDYRTGDHVPYVGRAPGTDAIYVATGMRKWGLSNGTAAAAILSDLLAGRDNPWTEVYDAGRIGDAQAVASLVKDNLKVGKEFAAGHLGRFISGGADHLEVGEGGLLDIDGHAVGAYRDHDGAVHTVEPVCTHLGCALTWNTADTSWDCNCHGSRFDPDGQVLNGPAVRPLEQPGR